MRIFKCVIFVAVLLVTIPSTVVASTLPNEWELLVSYSCEETDTGLTVTVDIGSSDLYWISNQDPPYLVVYYFIVDGVVAGELGRRWNDFLFDYDYTDAIEQFSATWEYSAAEIVGKTLSVTVQVLSSEVYVEDGNVWYLALEELRSSDVVFDCIYDADSDGYSSNDGDCDDLDAATYPGAPELCDGKDNDCDDIADNGIVPLPTSCGVGACAAAGEEICSGGVMVDTCVAGAPTAETCDGVDNDCDATVDEDIPAQPTTCGVGECGTTGELTCVDAQLVDSCEPGLPSAEICDGLDNDCDGIGDNGIAPVPTSCGVGECFSEGQEICTDGALVDTCDAGDPSPEVCDGLDNDCDATVDEGIAPLPTSCGVGECGATGELVCINAQLTDTCEPGLPTVEICDGLDNDCDGSTDNGIAPVPTYCGVGECYDVGEEICSDGILIDTCEAGLPAEFEECDGLDNDCDGVVPDDEVDDDLDSYLACEDCSPEVYRDDDPFINPGAFEIPGNFIDEDCNGDLGPCDPCLDLDEDGVIDWKNHGHYVRCVAHDAEWLVENGYLTQEEADAFVSSAAQSQVGKKNFIPEECQ